jgi:hypothetical protein
MINNLFLFQLCIMMDDHLHVRINGEISYFSKGDSFGVPPGKSFKVGNSSDSDGVIALLQFRVKAPK